MYFILKLIVNSLTKQMHPVFPIYGLLKGYNLRKGFSCVNNVKALYLSYELMWIYTADKQTEDLYSNWNAEGLSNQLLLSSCNLEFSKIIQYFLFMGC
jgi:hypothetical protein